MAIMMRNLILIGAILLVSASASVCQFHKSKNPVSVLNEYLLVNVVEDDFVDNMKALDEYKAGPKDKKVQQLASLLSNLDRTFEPENICSESHLKTLRETFEAVYSYDPESFKDPKVDIRLNSLLYNYFGDVFDICIHFYREKWVQSYDRLVKLGLEGDIWTEVDHITQGHCYKYHYTVSEECKIRGAFRLFQGKWKPSKGELKKALKNTQEGTVDAKLLKSKAYLTKILLKPCRLLLNDAEAKTILEPITDLGTALYLSGRFKGIWTPLVWAGRSFFCKWAIGKGEDQVAKMIL